MKKGALLTIFLIVISIGLVILFINTNQQNITIKNNNRQSNNLDGKENLETTVKDVYHKGEELIPVPLPNAGLEPDGKPEYEAEFIK